MIKFLNNLFHKKVEVVEQATVLPERTEPQHMHSWVVVTRTYAPPVKVNANTVTGSDKSMFGVTTILWECATCGETRKEEMLGSEQSTLDELIDKVRKTGPQYIEDGGETFVFNKWTPVSAAPGVLPLR